MRFKVEVLVILVFFLSFIIWAVSQCNTSSLLAEYNDPTEASGDEGGALAPRDSNPEDGVSCTISTRKSHRSRFI